MLQENTEKVTGLPTTSLNKCHFYYGLEMQKQWVESIGIFLDFVGSKYSQSMKASLEAGELIVIEVDETVLKKFNTKQGEIDHLATLKYWEQEVYT